MGISEIYRSLSEEQLRRVNECRSARELLAMAKAENIPLSDDDLEVIYMRIYKDRWNEMIETGPYDLYFATSDAWTDLIREARENEKRIRLEYPASEDMDALAAKLIADENETLQDLLRESDSINSFFDSCMKLRTPFWEATRRKVAREQVRLIEYLKLNPPVPVTSDDLLSLWNTANRMEPLGYDDTSAHFRTATDIAPFSHRAKYTEDGMMPPGFDTASPEEIPEAVNTLLQWIHRTDVDKEIIAAAAHFILCRIHPFPDQNGHTARMLCCTLLSPDYSSATLTAFMYQLFKNRSLICNHSRFAAIAEGNMSPGVFAMLQLLLLAQRRILNPNIKTNLMEL